MFQPLYVAATGLSAMEDEILNITNNLSNAKTTAFKRGRTEMESLTYIQKSFKDELSSAMQALEGSSSVIPEFGTGVKVAATPKDFTQGTIETTSNPLDLAIQGSGFFQVKLPDGSIAYTRAGNFHADNEGSIVDSNGHLLDPAIILPDGTTSIVIRQDGTILASVNNQISQTEVGRVTLAKFPNIAGLKSLGQNLYQASDSSGDPSFGYPADESFGTVVQYGLEASNVDVVSEMMRMVMIQRNFEAITKSVSSYEAMLTALERMKA